MAIIQNRITILDSGMPIFSKWWCKGAIKNILLFVSLNDPTWRITESASATKIPPTIANTISCFMSTLVPPRVAPRDNDPVSPIKTIAGGALYQRNPKADPIMAAQRTVNSPAPGK